MKLYSQTFEGYRTLVEAALPTYLPTPKDGEETVCRAMAYACEAGGKRLRPVLLTAFAVLAGGKADKVMPFACAIEMLHNYSLVHDDLPCMDNSPLRHGKPSVHTAYGEDMAVLCGDALLNRVFEVVLCADVMQDTEASCRLRASYVLARAAGIRGMIGGQTIDLENEGKPISLDLLEELHRKKTGALLTAACEMGAILGGGDERFIAAAREYGQCVGLCFQLVDDILDVTATAAELGKPVGGDAQNEKNTYVSLLGLEETRRLAAKQTEKAIAALDGIDGAEDLKALATALLSRTT